MTEQELITLLQVARKRPLENFLNAAKTSGISKRVATVTEKTRRWLARCGLERSLIYKTLLLTGLRHGELAALTWGDLDLGRRAYITVKAVSAKNRKTEALPLRADLAAELQAWRPAKARNDDRVFNVPRNLLRILKKDLAAAGIPYKDDRGRTLDVHALRHTFGTHLSKAGVWPRTAQSLMRHSDIDLTMRTYTDPRVLDMANAIDSLPALPSLMGEEELAPKSERLRATGTDEVVSCRHVGQHVGDSDPGRRRRSSAGTDEQRRSGRPLRDGFDVSGAPDKGKEPVSPSDIGSQSDTPKGTRTPVFRMRT